MKLLHLLILSAVLSSCIVAGGNVNRGNWAVASLGTDATNLNVSSNGISADSINQSEGLKSANKVLTDTARLAAQRGVLNTALNRFDKVQVSQ